MGSMKDALKIVVAALGFTALACHAASDGPKTVRVNVQESIAIDSEIPDTVTFDVDQINYGAPDEQTYPLSVMVNSLSPSDRVSLQLITGPDQSDATGIWTNLLNAPVSPTTRVPYQLVYTACGDGAPSYNLSDAEGSGGCDNHTCIIPNENSNIVTRNTG